MNDLKKWFVRTAGKWTSERRYIYKNNNDPVIVSTEFEVRTDILNPSKPDFDVEIIWNSTGDTSSSGVMKCHWDGKSFTRDRGYMTDEGTSSILKLSNIDTIEMYTTYNGMSFREEVRLVSEDIRLRQTIAFKEGTKDFLLAGQYVEFRLKE